MDDVFQKQLAVFAYDAEDGNLTEQQTNSTLPEDFDGTSYCADLKITPGGELLACANMPSSNVAVFRIDSKTSGPKKIEDPISMPSPSCILIRWRSTFSQIERPV